MVRSKEVGAPHDSLLPASAPEKAAVKPVPTQRTHGYGGVQTGRKTARAHAVGGTRTPAVGAATHRRAVSSVAPVPRKSSLVGLWLGLPLIVAGSAASATWYFGFLGGTPLKDTAVARVNGKNLKVESAGAAHQASDEPKAKDAAPKIADEKLQKDAPEVAVAKPPEEQRAKDQADKITLSEKQPSAQEKVLQEKNLKRHEDFDGALAENKAGEFKKEASALITVFRAALKRFLAERERLNPRGDEDQVPGPEFTMDNAFNAWDSATQKYVLTRLKQIESPNSTTAQRTVQALEAVGNLQEFINDESLGGFPATTSKYEYLCGRLLSAIGKDDDANQAWSATLNFDIAGLSEMQKRKLLIVRKHVIYDLIKSKMNAKKYSDVETCVDQARTDSLTRQMFDEDIGKELLLDYARALVSGVETASADVEHAVRTLLAAAAREKPNSLWANTLSIAIAESIQNSSGKKLYLDLSAQEWFEAGKGAQLWGRLLHTKYEQRQKSTDANEKAEASVNHEGALWEFANAVDYFRHSIVQARRPKHGSLAVRLEVEPKAWFEMGQCYLRMQNNCEAIIAFHSLRTSFMPNSRVQWLPNIESMPKAYTKAVTNALETLDLTKEKGGVLALSADRIRMALAINENAHSDDWNMALKSRITRFDPDIGTPMATVLPIDLDAGLEPITIYTSQVYSLDDLFADTDGTERLSGHFSASGGRGSFGNRGGGGRKLMVKRHGGSKATENGVDSALRWLAYHQETDGHWDAKKYAAGEKTDTAVTSLALLAFLGAGHTEKVGEYKDCVKRAVEWLKNKQAANGLIFDTTDAGGHRGEGYPGAIATLAMAEAAAMSNLPETRGAAQKAINYCTETHQASEGFDKLGWRYHAKMEGDTSVTGWYVMALKSAKVAGLHVNHASFDGAIKYLDSVEHKGAGGDPGYAPASTYWYTVSNAHEAHSLTAIGCLCRQILGWKKEDLQASVEGFVAKGGVPTWGGNGGEVDLYYWYYGTLCAFQQGGDLWAKWNEALKTALLANQCKDGDNSGSWDPVGAFSMEWGRVGETALGALCLEVYYRYARLYSDAK